MNDHATRWVKTGLAWVGLAAGLGVCLGAAAGCGGAPCPRGAVSAPVSPAARQAPAQAVVQPALATTEPPRCVVPAPAPAQHAAADTAEHAPYPRGMCANHLREERSVARVLQRRYERTGGRASTVDVSFACDGLDADIDEIVVERGSGHGFSLQLFRLWRTEHEPDVFHVRALYYSLTHGSYAEYTYEIADAFEVRRAEVTLPASRILPLLSGVRAALTSRTREIEPPPAPLGSLHLSGSGSSADLHAVLRLRDRDGRTLERRYTGYLGSGGQDDYLGLLLAMESLDPILDALTPAPDALTADDQAFFAARWTEALPHFAELPYWWVRERIVSMAEKAGTPGLVGPLLSILRDLAPAPDDHAPREGRLALAAGSEDRTRVGIVNALARLTGFDARYDADRQPRTIADAAADYLASCTRAQPR